RDFHVTGVQTCALPIYKLTSLHGEVEALSQRYITSQPKVYKEMEKIVKNTDTALRDITKMLATDDETFYAYTHLSDKEGIFNAKDRKSTRLTSSHVKTS